MLLKSQVKSNTHTKTTRRRKILKAYCIAGISLRGNSLSITRHPTASTVHSVGFVQPLASQTCYNQQVNERAWTAGQECTAELPETIQHNAQRQLTGSKCGRHTA